MLQIIESNQRLHEEEKYLRHPQWIFLVACNLVELFDRVIGDISQGAAKKGWNTRNRHCLIASQQLFQ